MNEGVFIGDKMSQIKFVAQGCGGLIEDGNATNMHLYLDINITNGTMRYNQLSIITYLKRSNFTHAEVPFQIYIWLLPMA